MKTIIEVVSKSYDKHLEKVYGSAESAKFLGKPRMSIYNIYIFDFFLVCIVFFDHLYYNTPTN